MKKDFGPKDEWGRFNDSVLKPSILDSFIPKKKYCDITFQVGQTGKWKFKGKEIQVLASPKDRAKKALRGTLCYDKRNQGIFITVSIAVVIIGLIMALVTYFSDWSTYAEISLKMTISAYIIIIGVIMSIFAFIMWKRSNKALHSLG